MHERMALKRFRTLTVFALIGCFLLSTGCSGKSPATSGNGDTDGGAISSLKLPVTTQDITLTYWCDLSKAAGTVQTLNDNPTAQELQKRTGVKLEYQHPAVGDAATQFNLMVASGTYPDLIEYGWPTVPGGPAEFENNNVIIDLTSAIKDYAPDLTKAFEQYPIMRKQSELDDGTYFMFPSYYADLELARSMGPVIRQDWFKTLNLPQPVTVDDWTNLFAKVKEAYPNASPFYFNAQGTSPKSGDIDITYFLSGAYGVTTGFNLDGKGKVEFGPTDPRFKDFLQQLNAWYKAGYIDPDSMSGSAKIKDTKYESDKTFMTLASMGDNVTRYTALVQQKEPSFEMAALPYPVLKKGDPPAPVYSGFQAGGGVAITSACKHVKEAVEMLDYCYTDEGHMLLNYGIEGQTYNMVNGKPQYTDLITKNPDGLSRSQTMAKYTLWESAVANIKFKDVLNARDCLPTQINTREEWMKADNSIILPMLLPTKEESNEMSGIMSDIYTYTQEMFNSFVTGKTPLSDYSSYVDRLKSMNIDRAVQLEQNAYDRYASRK